MQNQNRTAQRVEREPSRILQELREHAATHPNFAEKAKKAGFEFTESWLRKDAERWAFAGLREWKRLIPAVARNSVSQHERAILSACELLKDVVIEEET